MASSQPLPYPHNQAGATYGAIGTGLDVTYYPSVTGATASAAAPAMRTRAGASLGAASAAAEVDSPRRTDAAQLAARTASRITVQQHGGRLPHKAAAAVDKARPQRHNPPQVDGPGDEDRKDGRGLGLDSEQLSSADDDVSDGDADGLAETTVDIAVCQFTKVSHVRNKWKCHLCAGIAHVDGQDHVFDRCTGDFTWP